MKRIILAIILLSVILLPTLATSNKALAVDVLKNLCSPSTPGNGSTYNPDAQGTPDVCVDGGAADTTNPIYTILKIVIDILSYTVGVAAVIVIIVQGIRMITSGGDPNSISSARNGILYAVFGIVFAILAQVFVALVLDKFST